MGELKEHISKESWKESRHFNCHKEWDKEPPQPPGEKQEYSVKKKHLQSPETWHYSRWVPRLEKGRRQTGEARAVGCGRRLSDWLLQSCERVLSSKWWQTFRSSGWTRRIICEVEVRSSGASSVWEGWSHTKDREKGQTVLWTLHLRGFFCHQLVGFLSQKYAFSWVGRLHFLWIPAIWCCLVSWFFTCCHRDLRWAGTNLIPSFKAADRKCESSQRFWLWLKNVRKF